MALHGQGVLAIWHTMAAEAEAEYWRWHDREHIPERVAVPGFRRGRRYRHGQRPLAYLDLYEVDDSAILSSAPYLARLNDPTPWTRRVVPHFRDTVRFGYRLVATSGRGQGGLLVTARLHPAPGSAGLPAAGIVADLRRVAGDPAGLLAVHVLEVVPEVTRIPTAEKRLRTQVAPEPEAVPEPWLVLAECTDESTATEVAAGPLGPGGRAGLGAGSAAVVDWYRLQITLDAGEPVAPAGPA